MTDDELDASFDAAMRDTLDAGKPVPAQMASEASLRAAYANWRPYKVVLKGGSEWGKGEVAVPPSDASAVQQQCEAGWKAYEREFRARKRHRT
jgi:hypothetical protein